MQYTINPKQALGKPNAEIEIHSVIHMVFIMAFK